MYDLLIKNGLLVTSEKVQRGDLAIQDGKIAAILSSSDPHWAKECIFADNLLVFPGAIDTHAHLNDPGYTWREDFLHGTQAAAVGGFTTILDMPLQNEPAMTTAALFDRKQQLVAPNACTDYCFYGGLIPENFRDLSALNEKGCIAFKSFIGPVSLDYSPLNYGQAYEAMRLIQNFGGKVCFHCEDYSMIKHLEQLMRSSGRSDWRAFLDSRPVAAEMVATTAIIELAKATGCRVHICHVSSPDVADRIAAAQREGYDITAETCAHYLSMTDEDVLQKGALFKCAPPLRSQDEVNRLWEHVANGTFSGLASDHSPCAYEEKFGSDLLTPFDVWGGISGIQSCLQVAYDEGCVKRGLSPSVLAAAMCEKPAKAFGLFGKKGSIDIGFDADLVLLDPNAAWEITAESLLYRNQLSAFVGKTGIGTPVMTLLRGQKVAESGAYIAKPGCGLLCRGTAPDAAIM